MEAEEGRMLHRVGGETGSGLIGKCYQITGKVQLLRGTVSVWYILLTEERTQTG